MTTAWQEYRLKYLVRPVVDKATSPDAVGPYVGLEAITSWTGEIDTEKNEETGESLGNRFRSGDVLFGKLRPYLAKVAAPEFAGHCSSEALVLRPSPRIDTRFLRYRMVEAGTIDAVNASTYGAKMPRASWDFIGNLRLNVPHRETQNAIAEFLDHETARIDQLIERKQRLLEVLSSKRSSEILLTVTSGLNRQAEKKFSKLNDAERVPQHWEERRLSTVCRFFQGKAHEPFFDDDGAYIAVTARFVSTNGEQAKRCSKNLSPARSGDILMVMSDLPNGRALARSFLVMRDDLYAVNQRVCALTPLFGDSRFYAYQLNRNDQLLRYNDGFNQTHLKNRYFLQLMLRVPPVEEQILIADYLDRQIGKIDGIVDKTNDSIDRLREFRTALITAAVKGQIDVTTWGKHGQTDRRLDQIEEEMSVREARA